MVLTEKWLVLQPWIILDAVGYLVCVLSDGPWRGAPVLGSDPWLDEASSQRHDLGRAPQ